MGRDRPLQFLKVSKYSPGTFWSRDVLFLVPLVSGTGEEGEKKAKNCFHVFLRPAAKARR